MGGFAGRGEGRIIEAKINVDEEECIDLYCTYISSFVLLFVLHFVFVSVKGPWSHLFLIEFHFHFLSNA